MSPLSRASRAFRNSWYLNQRGTETGKGEEKESWVDVTSGKAMQVLDTAYFA